MKGHYSIKVNDVEMYKTIRRYRQHAQNFTNLFTLKQSLWASQNQKEKVAPGIAI